MSLDDAISLALRTLYKGTNERFNERSIEISAISKGKFKKLSEEAVKKHILKAIEDVKKGK